MIQTSSKEGIFWSREFYMAWSFPLVWETSDFLDVCMTHICKYTSAHSIPPNSWMHLRIWWRTYDFHSAEKWISNQLTKASDYKQAARLTVGQLASKTGHGFPGTEENVQPHQDWAKASLGSQNWHTAGKMIGFLCWPTISIRPADQLQVILESMFLQADSTWPMAWETWN